MAVSVDLIGAVGRAHAGMPPLPSDGFIAHYLTGVLYPDDAVGVVQLLVAVIVAVSWGLSVCRVRRGYSSTGTRSAPQEDR